MGNGDLRQGAYFSCHHFKAVGLLVNRNPDLMLNVGIFDSENEDVVELWGVFDPTGLEDTLRYLPCF